MEPKKNDEFRSIHIHWTQTPQVDQNLQNSLEQALRSLQKILDNADEDYLNMAQHEASTDFEEEINEQEMDTFFDMIHYEIVDSKVTGDLHPEAYDLIMNAYHKHKA